LSSDEVIINGRSEKELMEITESTEKKLARLFKDYPCICYPASTDKDNLGARDISFNEQYLKELGYSIETFATTVLQGGIPR